MTPALHERLIQWKGSPNERLRRHAAHRLGLADAVGYTPPTAPAAPVLGRTIGSPLDPWTIVTVEQISRDALAMVSALPASIDAVAAVSRSGLLPGGLIASCLHLPLWCVSRVHGVVDPGHGWRMGSEWQPNPETPAHVLVIDDTAANGYEITASADIVRKRFPGAAITRAVVYCHPQALGKIDLCHALYDGQHYLAWNWPNAGHGQRCGYDFDGILCRDPTPEECQDEALYRRFLAEATPLYLPRRTPVPLIVSARPEWARDASMDWLTRHGVRCDSLILRPIDAPIWGQNQTEIAAYKARHYQASSCVLFAESSPEQARRIRDLAGKPVLCPEAGRVFPAAAAASGRPSVAQHWARIQEIKACRFFDRSEGCGCVFGRCLDSGKPTSFGACDACLKGQRDETG